MHESKLLLLARAFIRYLEPIMTDFDDDAGPNAAAMADPPAASPAKKRGQEPQNVLPVKCPLQNCADFKKVGSRFCHRHTRHLESMRAQAGAVREEQKPAFNNRMKNHETPIQEVS